MEPQNNTDQTIPMQDNIVAPTPTQSANTSPDASLTDSSKPTSKNKLLIPIIILSIVAVCGIVFGIVGMVLLANSNATIENLRTQLNSQSNTQPDDEKDNTKNTPGTDYGDVYGYWLSEGGSYFNFTDESFTWWKEKNDLSDNYYSGDIEIFQGDSALETLNTTYDKVLKISVASGGNINLDDIYALKLYPTTLISGGIDKSADLEVNFPAGNDYMLMSFIVTGDGQAQAYNYSSETTYNLTKDK